MVEQDKEIQIVLDKYKNELMLKYDQLTKEIELALKKKLEEKNIKIASLTNRVKTLESFKDKIERKNYTDPLNENDDFAGVRVVCLYEHELENISSIIKNEFTVIKEENKKNELGTEKMGYQGTSFIVRLKENYGGYLHKELENIKCEIQTRTVLQDAWALLNHNLVYKNERSIPEKLRRNINNVSSLVEIAQNIFDSAYKERMSYIKEIHMKESTPKEFLSQPVDYDTLIAYTKWKFPDKPISEYWNNRLFEDINLDKYSSLENINHVIELARPAVEAYSKENPEMFKTSTAFLTKSLGFVDNEFCMRHPFGQQTRAAFVKYSHMVQTKK